MASGEAPTADGSDGFFMTVGFSLMSWGPEASPEAAKALGSTGIGVPYRCGKRVANLGVVVVLSAAAAAGLPALEPPPGGAQLKAATCSLTAESGAASGSFLTTLLFFRVL